MWQYLKLLVVVAAAALIAPTVANANPAAPNTGPSTGQSASQPFMRVFGPSLPPYGYVRFCSAFPAECAGNSLEEARIVATAERMAELDVLNRQVNKAIDPATDLEVYGEEERWTLPTTRGDCEDYALLKRHVLMRRGWPASALLMTVVRDEKGEGHAVLTARTSKGDYILDNKTDEMRLWSKTNYVFVMRQSYIDPNVWLSLNPRDLQQPQLLGGTRDGG